MTFNILKIWILFISEEPRGSLFQTRRETGELFPPPEHEKREHIGQKSKVKTTLLI